MAAHVPPTVSAVDSYDEVDLSDVHPKPRLRSYNALCCCCTVIASAFALTAAVSATIYLRGTLHSPIFTPVTGTGVDDDPAEAPAEEPIRGVNLGGWLVLEPWITPSLFYDFLDDERPATDEKLLCAKWGADEARARLKEFRDVWVTEDTFRRLREVGLNTARVPYGYWVFGDAPGFCENVSSIEYLDLAVDWAEANGINLLLDMHGAKGSQNGFDNSGESHKYPFGDGAYDGASWLRAENANATLSTLSRVAERYKGRTVVKYMGLVNEPIGFHLSGYCTANCPIPVGPLTDFYLAAWAAIGKHLPDTRPVVDQSFRPHVWSHLRDADAPWVPARALVDSHRYHAFWPRASSLPQVAHLRISACDTASDVASQAAESLPTVVGEWSTAVSDCMIWLNGLGVPVTWSDKSDCGRLPCPTTFSNGSLPAFVREGRPAPPGAAGGPDEAGMCAVDPFTAPWGPFNYSEFYTAFYAYAMGGYEASAGWFFWNFRNEMGDPRWGFLDAADAGWLPRSLRGYRPARPDCAAADAAGASWQEALVTLIVATVGLAMSLCCLCCAAYGRARARRDVAFSRMLNKTPVPSTQGSVEMTTAQDHDFGPPGPAPA